MLDDSREHTMRNFLLLLLILICAALLSACWWQGVMGLHSPSVVGANDSPFLRGIATITPTPFQPVPPTPTFLPSNNSSLGVSSPSYISNSQEYGGDFPPPSVPADMPIPPPVGRLPQPDGQVNILLLGSDQIPGDYGYRTDSILLLTLNTKENTASITSFPRDLYVYIPGWTMQRINTAHAYGGFDAIAMTFEYNFGVRPDHYAMINFWSFVQVIDRLGGIDVPVETPMPYDCGSIPTGVVHMYGEMALCYVRERITSSDFDRAHRQQDVLQAIFKRLLSLNAIARAPELYSIYSQNVTTDLTFSDIAPLLPLAAKLSDTSRIRRYYIGREHVTEWINYSGMYVLIPNRDAVLSVMRQALNSP